MICLTSSCLHAAVEEFLQLYESIKNCSLVSKTLKNGLTPEATVEHAKTMLGRDDRMRLFVLAEARHGAMFACTQAKVNVVGGSPSGANPRSC